MASARTTTNHDEIKQWAESRHARPATVKRTSNPEDPGILRLHFDGFSDDGALKEIDWEEWFRKFDAQSLALLYQEETREGKPSNFNRLVNRNSRRVKTMV